MSDDHYKQFPPNLLRKGTTGGAEAADRLLGEIASLIQGWDGANNWKILVRIYASTEGLIRKSRKLSELIGELDITEFARDFSQRQPFLDFINVANDAAVGRKSGGQSISGYYSQCCL